MLYLSFEVKTQKVQLVMTVNLTQEIEHIFSRELLSSFYTYTQLQAIVHNGTCRTQADTNSHSGDKVMSRLDWTWWCTPKR